MARTRIRTVKPDLFRHDGLFEAEQSSGLPLRLAFIALFTIADREGRFRWQPRRMKLDMFPYDAIDIAAVLDALHAHGFIARYEVDAEVYGFIPSWANHQTPNNREPESECPDPHVHGKVSLVHAQATLSNTCASTSGMGMGMGSGIGRELEGKGNGKGALSRVRQPEQLSDVTAHFLMVKSTVEEAEAFYSHYEAQGWKTGNGMVITNWRAKADSWIKNNRERKATNGTRKSGVGDRVTTTDVRSYNERISQAIGIDPKGEPSALVPPNAQPLARSTQDRIGTRTDSGDAGDAASGELHSRASGTG